MAKKELPNYPLVGFHFKVEFLDSKSNELYKETSFQEVGGITAEIGVEELQEGGVNDYSHRLPGKTKYGNLVLKRGMTKDDSKIISWALDAINNRVFKPLDIHVTLMNSEREPVIAWQYFRAWPVKLVSSDLKAQDSSVAVETMELSFSYMKRVYSAS